MIGINLVEPSRREKLVKFVLRSMRHGCISRLLGQESAYLGGKLSYSTTKLYAKSSDLIR